LQIGYKDGLGHSDEKWKARIQAKRQEHKTRNDNEMKGGKSETRKKYMRKYYKSLHIQ
jgi:hypothetical protein